MNYRITADAEGTVWESGSWYNLQGDTTPPTFYIKNNDTNTLKFDTFSLYYATPYDTKTANGFNGTRTEITYTVPNTDNSATITTPVTRGYPYGSGYPNDPSRYNYTTEGAETYAKNGEKVDAIFSNIIEIAPGETLQIDMSYTQASGAGVQFFPLISANVSVSHTVWSYHKDEGWKKDKDIYIYNSDSGTWVKQTKFHLYSEGVWTDKS